MVIGTGRALYIVPSTAVRISDAFELDGRVQRFIENAARGDFIRVKRQLMLDSYGACVYCGDVGNVEYHHIKPIWVFCLQLILSRELYKRQGMGGITREKFDFTDLNDIKNLDELCPACHKKEETGTRKFYRGVFELSDPAVISYNPLYNGTRLEVKLRQNALAMGLSLDEWRRLKPMAAT